MREGYIAKSHPKSWFNRFHYNSPLAKRLFGKESDTIVLQIILHDSDNFLAELVSRVDYERATE